MALVGLLLGLSGSRADGLEPPGGATSRPLGAAAADADDPWSSPDIAAPRLDGSFVRRPTTSRTATASESASQRSGWWRTTGALGGVVALIVLLAWGYRLITGGGGRLTLRGRTPRPELIELLSRLTVAPRQALYLVRIGPRLVLIGAASDSLRTLLSIDDPDVVARLVGRRAAESPESHVAEFGRCLAAEARTYQDEPVAADSRAGVRTLPDGLARVLTSALQRVQTMGRPAGTPRGAPGRKREEADRPRRGDHPRATGRGDNQTRAALNQSLA